MQNSIIFFSVAQQPNSGLDRLTVAVSRSHTIRHTHTHTHTHIRYDSSKRVISSSQRPLPTQQIQETNINAPGEIQTHNPSKQTAACLRLRRRGHQLSIFKGKAARYRPEQALRVPGGWAPRFLDNRHMKVAGCQPYAPAAFTAQEVCLVLISVRG
jgi:hypothetical protein